MLRMTENGLKQARCEAKDQAFRCSLCMILVAFREGIVAAAAEMLLNIV